MIGDHFMATLCRLDGFCSLLFRILSRTRVERYKSFRKDNRLFNIGNLDSINKRIKKVAAMCGIKKRVSFHVSRHSWAVLALEYGMPIESVSKILGHTNITTTQIYAKVTSTKLNHDISVFESRIKGHLPVMGGMA